MRDIRDSISKLSPQQLALVSKKLAERRTATPVGKIPRRQDAAPCQLSPAQERLWFLHQLHPHDTNYNVSAVLRAEGPLNVAALRLSIEEVARRHEALRTVFEEGPDGPLQRTATQVTPVFVRIDMSLLDVAARNAYVIAVKKQFNHPFDLRSGQLLRLAVLRFNES